MEYVSRWGGGGGRHALVWLTQVGYQGVEFYYFKSKILIIYFIILIVKFYFNSKFASKCLEQCPFGLEALKRL